MTIGRRSAAYLDRLGPADEIRYGELVVPCGGPADVLVEVAATTVNRVDTFVRSGAFRTPVDFPFVIGRDLVGTVLQAGPGAVGFTAGQQVWSNSLGHGGRQGAAASQVVVAADRLYHLPPEVDPVAAVPVLHPGATAYLGLFVHARIRPGDWLLVLGGAGNVGSAMITLAAHAGARVIAGARPDDEVWCRSLGAEAVVDYRDSDWPAQVREIRPAGLDVIADTFGVNDLLTTVDLLAQRGRILLLAGMGSQPVLPAGQLYLKDAAVLGFVISHASTSELAAAATLINQLLSSGRLRSRSITRLPLRAAAQAHQRVEAGGLRGERLVLIPSP